MITINRQMNNPDLEDLLSNIRGLGFIAGGYVRNLYFNIVDTSSDLDIFPTNLVNYDKLYKWLYKNFSLTTATNNAVTFENNAWPSLPKKIQLISNPVYMAESVENLINTFDFTFISAAIADLNIFIVHDTFVPDNEYMRFNFTNQEILNRNPYSLFHRIFKYREKGFYRNFKTTIDQICAKIASLTPEQKLLYNSESSYG